MEWSDHGSVLAARAHGESAALVELFTAEHGRHAGLLRGGAGRKRAPDLQPGTFVAVSWRARLSDHLGTLTLEPERGRAGALLGDRLGLAGLNAICALLLACLPERLPFPELYAETEQLFDLLALTPAWPLAYLRWELSLLEAIGFGLELEQCAVTGGQDNLIFVSPRTGRAVSRDAAGEWSDRLLPLPDCLRGKGTAPDAEILDGLNVTGHFLSRALGETHSDIPPARMRLVDLLARQASGTNSI